MGTFLAWGVGLEAWPRAAGALDAAPLAWALLFLVGARLALGLRVRALTVLGAVVAGALWADLVHRWGLVAPGVAGLLALLVGGVLGSRRRRPA